MIKKFSRPTAPSAICLGLIAALTLAGCSDSDGNTVDLPDTTGIADPNDTNTTDTGTTDTGGTTDTTSETVGTASSTAGVVCDYVYIEYNASPSVDAMSESAWTCNDSSRELTANGIPDHETGEFPSAANPNTISEQAVSASYTLDPIATDTATELGGPRGAVGHVLNGIKMDPGTGGSCNDSGDTCSGGDPSLGWNLEALGQTSFDFGDDMNNAHVQPTGTYHYHGMPEGFIDRVGGGASNMTLIGWAADGFPIYARYGHEDPTDASTALKVIEGSYQTVNTVSESRPSTDLYALGTFQQDWEYVAGSGDLDECNGRTGVTPEFPGGIYHYFATDSYPYMQRCVKGSVASVGEIGPAPGGPAGPGAPDGAGAPEGAGDVFGSAATSQSRGPISL